MIIDLLHNQIISNTITEKFTEGVERNLIPALRAIYGEKMLGIQMYEDHLADEFLLDGVFYYPMTVVLQDKQVIHWISWSVTADKFTDLIPYAYIGGEELSFELAPSVPIEVETAIIGRSIYCEDGLIKINVRSTSPSPTFLAGKYSQTFIDEMARQLTRQISEKMSVEGLADSGLALEVEFAPVTFMEHISENVTYRRLLLTDGASAPRDFWVKWTKRHSATPFTVSDHPVSDEIEFLIGEGVPQKIREREYRHLIRTNNDKYQNAMGRRNITEWRDLIKRAVKRGRLTQVIRQLPLDDDVALINAALASVTGLSTADVVSAGVIYDDEARNADIANEFAKAAGIEVDEYVDEPEETMPQENNDDIERELLELIAHNIAHKNDAPDSREDDVIDFHAVSDEEDLDEEIEEDLDEEIEEDLDEEIEEDLDEEIEEDLDEEIEEDLDEEIEEDLDEEIEEETEEELEVEIVELPEEEQAEESVVEEPVIEEPVVAESVVAEPVIEEPATEEKIEEIEENTVMVSKNVVESVEKRGSDVIADFEKIKAQLCEAIDAQVRLEYEKQARANAESEMAELRRKHEQLIIENRRLEAQAKKEYEERRRISEQRKLENEKLRAEIEARAKAEAIEKERLVESARSAIEEKHRLERERLEEERRRIEDERRLAEDRAREAAEARVMAERALEAERIRLAAQAAAANGQVEEEQPVDKYADYTYIAKNVRLIFRGVLDYNVTVEIQKLIVKTLEKFDKSDLHIRVRATVPNNTTVLLEFLEYPEQEMELLYDIIKVIGSAGLGIAKAVLEDPKK